MARNPRAAGGKRSTPLSQLRAPNPEMWARSPCDVAREGVELMRKLLKDAVPTYAMRHLMNDTAAPTTDPALCSLNDRSIAAIPATVRKQRYVTSVAPRRPSGRWVEQPRLPIQPADAVIECQGNIRIIAGVCAASFDANFHQVYDSKAHTWSLKATFQWQATTLRRRCPSAQTTPSAASSKREPLPIFALLRLRLHGDRPMDADCRTVASAQRHLDVRAAAKLKCCSAAAMTPVHRWVAASLIRDVNIQRASMRDSDLPNHSSASATIWASPSR